MSDEATTSATIIESTLAEINTPAPEEVPAEQPIAGEEGAPAEDQAAEPEAAEGGEQPAATAQPEKPKKRQIIPLDRHQAVLTKARREADAKAAELQARIDALAKYENPEVQNKLRFLDLLETEPNRAVEVLRTLDPTRFGKLTWAEQQAAAAEAARTETAPADMPEPDVLLPDGSPGYSADASRKLAEWIRQQERTEREKELKAIREELQPVLQERQTREALQQSYTRMSSLLADARQNWPAFTENEAAMREWMGKPGHERKTLHDAYVAVVAPQLRDSAKIAKDREAAIRAEERKKMAEEAAAKTRGLGPRPGGLPSAGGDAAAETSSESIIMAELQRIKSAA